MTLDDLLTGKGDDVEHWLRERNLLHECPCGHTLVDDVAVTEAVQDAFGDQRANEITAWAQNLIHRFGWKAMVESSVPSLGLYRCQNCAG